MFNTRLIYLSTMKFPIILLILGLFLSPVIRAQSQETQAASGKYESSDEHRPVGQITLANGIENWIIIDDMQRDQSQLLFKEVNIEADGWLVLHPFKEGRPNGDIYVGASFLEAGINKDVTVTIDENAAEQEQFLVMLHGDVNHNQEFDFVFVDERNVVDRAVFEGNTMIAHILTVPLDKK